MQGLAVSTVEYYIGVYIRICGQYGSWRACLGKGKDGELVTAVRQRLVRHEWSEESASGRHSACLLPTTNALNSKPRPPTASTERQSKNLI